MSARLPPADKELITAASNAAAMLAAVYEHVDRVNAAGGATSISGVAACHAMLKSLNANRDRAEKLIMAPLRTILADQAASA